MSAPITLATSFKDTAPLELFDLSPSSASSSGSCTPVGTDDIFYPHELETTFCRDFSCCGLILEDLHDLLQHYEECHVRLESDVSLDLLGFEDDWHSSSSSESDPSTHPSPYLKATQVPFMKHSSLYSNGTIMPFGQDELSLAAFDAAMLKAASTISSPTNPASPLTLNPSVTTNSAPVSDVETGLDTPVTSAPSTPKPKSRKRPASATSSGRASKKIATGGSRIRSLNSSAASSRASSDTEGGESVPSEQREKPYRCPVEGCGKAYKNPNGLKYHNLHGHCNTGADGDVTPRPHLCTYENCGKSYKNMNGLKYHIQHTHLPRPSTTPSTPMHTAVQS